MTMKVHMLRHIPMCTFGYSRATRMSPLMGL